MYGHSRYTYVRCEDWESPPSVVNLFNKSDRVIPVLMLSVACSTPAIQSVWSLSLHGRLCCDPNGANALKQKIMRSTNRRSRTIRHLQAQRACTCRPLEAERGFTYQASM